MQATIHRSLVSHPRAALAVALAVVIAGIIIVASLALSTASSPTAASVKSPAQEQRSNGYMDMRMLEDNIWQIPYTAPRNLTYEEITLIESNTFQIPYIAPALSYAQVRFIEENTLGFHDPGSSSLATDPLNVNQAGCSSLHVDRIQPGCKDY